MMSSKLSKLIAYHETARSQLLAQIADFLAESEYSLAHRHSKALRIVEEKLRTYHALADPLHDEKALRIKNIERLKKHIAAGTSNVQLSYYLERLLQEQQRLDELNQAVAATPGQSKKSILQDVLSKLLERKIDKFTLIIDEAEGVHGTIQLVRRILIIDFLHIQRLVTNCVLCKKQIKYFQSLGFRLYDSKDKLMLFLPYSTKEDLFTVKTILARIVFEAFAPKAFSETAYVKYVESI